MSGEGRAEKRTRLGAVKHVYDRPTLAAARAVFEREVAARLPQARLLYFT